MPRVDLKERMKGIGGSEIGALCGVDRFKDAMAVYNAKTVEDLQETPAGEAAEWGHEIEPLLRARLSRQLGVPVIEGGLVVDPEHPWRRCNTDADVPAKHSGGECKTIGIRSSHLCGASGTDQTVESHVLQCHWEMALIPAWRRVYVPTLIGGQEYRCYVIERDEEIIESLKEIVDRFWLDHVVPRRPPPIGPGDSTAEWLRRKFPQAGKDIVPATVEADAIASALRDARERKAKAEEDEALARHRLQALIGDAGGMAGSTWRASWHNRKSPVRTDWEALALELGNGTVPSQLVEKHSKQAPPTRVFAARFNEE